MTSRIITDQVFVRESNLSLVIRYIHNEAPVSRAQIAVATGLNKSTVSSLVEDLLKRRLVHETGINSGNQGRPATFLDINPKANLIIGVELGIDYVTVALTGLTSAIFWRETINNDPTKPQDKTIAQTLSLVNQAIKVAQEKDSNILGLGLAVPGPVNLNEGLLVYAPNLQWANVPLRKIFTESTGLKVYVENDANAAAIGEHLFGAARQTSDFIVIFVSSGIGGGLFLNGKLYRGKNGYAGEIGHSPILADPLRAPCRCGKYGCWEAYANQHSIIQNIRSRLDSSNNSIIPKLMAEQGNVLTISTIKQAADANDPIALEAFSKAGEVIGQGIASMLNIFNPETIILGGPLSIAGQYLLPSISASISKHSYPAINQEIDIRISNFGSDACLIGAIAIVVEDVLTKPSSVERR